LVQWGAAASLSHPHLSQLFEVGRYRTGGQDFLFVVMEYADQTLAEILSRRTLSHEEVRELLLPTLDALTFLHRRQLVHGQLKPSNILAVNDKLKLAGDTVCRVADCASSIIRPCSYDPPELQDSGPATAGDVWNLGMTLVEALTQRTPATAAAASLPADFPAPFADTVRRCLSPVAANRPNVLELKAHYRPTPAAPTPIPPPPAPVAVAPAALSIAAAPPSTPKAQPVMPSVAVSVVPAAPSMPPVAPSAVLRTTSPKHSVPNQRLPLVAIAVAMILISLGVWLGLRSSDTRQAASPPAVVLAAAPVAPAAIATPAQPTPAPATIVSAPPDMSLAVLHEATPTVPPAVSRKIQGRIYVTVRVLVDPAGNVAGVLPEDPGSSRYFARLAENAAREWRFGETDKPGARVWLLRFEFTRDGVATRAIAQ
ncbi:MAG: protein kinase, partial [Pseudomonadota bacterium]|nr:protein kinase [Pseudomonadota bacterium]